jgi:hypothetical protein
VEDSNVHWKPLVPKVCRLSLKHRTEVVCLLLLSVCWNDVKTECDRFSALREAFRRVQNGWKQTEPKSFPCVCSVLLPVASLL